MKKILIISTIILWLPVMAFSQSVIDSLETVLKYQTLNKEDRIATLSTLGYQYELSGLYNESLKNNLEALKILEEDHNFEQRELTIANIKMSIGNAYGYMYDYETSTKYYLETCKHYEDKGEFLQLGVVQINIAINYREMNDNIRARKVGKEGIDNIYKQYPFTTSMDSASVANCYLNLAQFEYYLNSPDGTKKHLDSAALYLDSLMIIESLENHVTYGMYYLLINEPEQALDEFKVAYDISTFYDLDKYIINNNTWIAKAYLAKNQIDSSNIILDQNIVDNEYVGNLMGLADAYDTKKELFLFTGEFDSAYHYSKLHEHIIYNLTDDEKLNNMDDQIVAYHTDKLEKEKVLDLELAEGKQEINNFRWTMACLGLVFLAIIFVVLFYRVQDKDKVASSLLEKEQLEEQKLQEEIKFKNSRLTNIALYISKKNEFINQIREELRTLTNTHSNEDLSLLIKEVSEELDISEEKGAFESNIDQSNKAFYEKLKTKFPDLTEKEMRLCSLLVLNLSSKEISSIFDITVGSVEKNRYRLRKKLGLEAGTNLQSYLMSI